jgi:hypothetical protein
MCTFIQVCKYSIALQSVLLLHIQVLHYLRSLFISEGADSTHILLKILLKSPFSQVTKILTASPF